MIGASRAVLNGRLVQEDLCLMPQNQRDAIVKRLQLTKSMRLSHQATECKNQTDGGSVLEEAAGELALEVTSHRKCLPRKFKKANTF